jgi:hypothetical protein
MKSGLSEKDLEACLVKCMSVHDVRALAEMSSKDPRILERISQLALVGDDTRAAKASWVLSKSAEIFKSDINPFANIILDRLASPMRSGIKRELLKALLFSNIHQSNDSRLLDILLALPFSGDDVGVKYLALRHLEKYAKYQPELKQEIISTLKMSKSSNPTLWSRQAQRLIDKMETKGGLIRKMNVKK